ncbi:MAG: phosphoglycolate phosphatase [Rubellimicrobium sp.]|nr:phosphoglycolate phosphatase [Rubellimicrobium sp.]
MRGAVVFDLDGTLVESAPQIMGVANELLAGEGAAPLSLPETVSFIGHGARVFVQRMIAARGLPDDAADRLYHDFAARAESNAEGAGLFPGVARALAALAKAGHPLGICTNKPAAPARAMLDLLGIGHRFTALVGGDSLPVLKPDPAPLHAAFAGLGAPFLYVGDSEVDFATARAANVPFALFTRGYRRGGPGDFPGARMFDDWADFPALVAGLA